MFMMAVRLKKLKNLICISFFFRISIAIYELFCTFAPIFRSLPCGMENTCIVDMQKK